MNPADKALLARIRLAAFDVDGVFTDGRIHLSDNGVETKAFCTLDGYGVRRLLEAGIEVAVISGRRSAAVERRMAELGVAHVMLGCDDKVAACEALLDRLGIAADDALYAGDDLPDLPLLQRVGASFAVANAHPDVVAACQFTTRWRGGYGAVRDVCDRLLQARETA
ncbi:MAG: HAD hydrolase family protein [Woeseiaceae bacterium]|nr:HAD hydrolase family protein [Woeseiaceae bacterium]